MTTQSPEPQLTFPPLATEDFLKASFAQRDPGVPAVANLGEDGEHYVALGHIPPTDFLEGMRAEWAYFTGDLEEFPEIGTEDVQHRYAVVTSHSGGGDWVIRLGICGEQVTEAVPGAFPITKWTAEL